MFDWLRSYSGWLKREKQYFWIILGAMLLLRLMVLLEFPYFWHHPDSNSHFQTAEIMIEKGEFGVHPQRTPLMGLLAYASIKISGYIDLLMLVQHLLGILFSFLIASVCYSISNGNNKLSLLLLLFLSCNGALIGYEHFYNGDYLYMIFAISALCFLYYFYQNGLKSFMVIATALICLSALTRGSGIVILLVVAIVVGMKYPAWKKGTFRKFISLGALAIFTATIFLAPYLYYQKTQWDTLSLVRSSGKTMFAMVAWWIEKDDLQKIDPRMDVMWESIQKFQNESDYTINELLYLKNGATNKFCQGVVKTYYADRAAHRLRADRFYQCDIYLGKLANSVLNRIWIQYSAVSIAKAAALLFLGAPALFFNPGISEDGVTRWNVDKESLQKFVKCRVGITKRCWDYFYKDGKPETFIPFTFSLSAIILSISAIILIPFQGLGFVLGLFLIRSRRGVWILWLGVLLVVLLTGFMGRPLPRYSIIVWPVGLLGSVFLLEYVLKELRRKLGKN